VRELVAALRLKCEAGWGDSAEFSDGLVAVAESDCDAPTGLERFEAPGRDVLGEARRDGQKDAAENDAEAAHWNDCMLKSMVLDQAVALLGTAVIVSLGVLFSNSRVSDISNRLNDTNGRIDAMQQNLIALIQAESGKLQAGMERIEGVMDARLRHLEEQLGRR